MTLAWATTCAPSCVSTRPRSGARYCSISPPRLSALDRLAFIGDRAMGALVFEPADDGDIKPENLSLRVLAKEIKHVVAGEKTDALKQLALIGGSPHGSRPKVLVNYELEAGIMSTVSTAAGTPWMVKFPARHEHKEVCAIEDLYARLASECGIGMPRTRYFDKGKSGQDEVVANARL